MKSSSKCLFAIFLCLLCISGAFLYYIQLDHADTPDAAVQISGISETQAGFEYLQQFPMLNTEHNTDIPDSFQLDVPFISQYPELPTGCEITSLTEVLHFYGYDIDKETLAEKYLPRCDTPVSGCFTHYFYGSPWDENGSGCFAPAIKSAANYFLKDVSSSLNAYTISYSSINTLFAQVAAGHPVIVWTSFNYDEPEVTYSQITLENGKTFSWPNNEHCVVLSGYDLNAQTVTLADPTHGIVTRSLDDFTHYYQKYSCQAVVIK